MPTILPYGIAVLSVAIANGLAFFVLRHFEAILTPFLFAVAATVWYAGTGPGVLAIVLSVLSLNHFFLRPGFSFGPISYADLVYLTFCIFCALAVGWVSAVRRRAEQELRQAREELEAKVVERTADLQRSERYLTETQKLTHTGSWAWDARSQKVLYCSEEMFRIYGLDPQVDLPTRKNFRQRVHPEDRNRTDERFVRLINEKVDSFDEYRVLLPDGTVKHVNSSGHPVLDGNGELIAVIGTATDVTARKCAEEALRESEAKIRRLVDSNIIGIFVWDFDGRILEANDEFLRIVSYDRKDLVSGRIRWAELTPPDWRDRNNARIEQQKSSGRFEPFEKEFSRKDGSRVPILIGGATFEEGGNQGVAFVLDLTERKCAEKALREREAKIRRLVDSNIIGIFIWDFDGRILEANDEFLRVVNYEREDLVSGRIRWTDLTPPDWRGRDNAKIEQQKISGRLEPFEKEYTRKDGRRVPVLIGVATFEESGNEGVAFVLDLTERKRAEEALRESEHKLRRIFDTVPGMLWSAGPDGEHTHINQRVLDYSGIPLEDFVHGGWQKRHHPDDFSHVAIAFSHALQTGTSYQVLSRLRRADGEYRWHHIRAEPLRDRQGNIIQWYGLSVDIDDQKQAEQALRRSEAHLAEAERLSHTGAVAYNGTAILFASEETYRIWGFDPAQGLPSRDVVFQRIHPGDRDRLTAEVRREVGEKRRYSIGYRIVLPDGTVKHLETIGQPVFSASGKLVEIFATQTDVTERKRAEEAYLEAQLELAHANRVATLGQLTASITHEVNQPITAAVTYALAARRFLSAEPPNLHEADDALSLIVREGNRAGDVIGRIRALIKKAPLRKDAVAINDAILEVIALTRTEAADNNVSVRTQLADGLPHIRGDRVQLQQVLLNLIINAIEAMRDVGEEEERELLISCRNEPDGVSVEVRDSGPGLAAPALERVFEAFYSTKPSGLGLGLSICRSIIEAHGGRLWASPNVPRGAIFGFILPAHPVAASCSKLASGR
jgi:PAS domain S-box-containing protein